MVQKKTVDNTLQFSIRSDEINAIMQTDKKFKQIAKEHCMLGTLINLTISTTHGACFTDNV